MKKFYDTNCLLLLGDELFQNNEHFFISSITIQELEDIKSSPRKDEETKYQARQLLRNLNLHKDQYTIIVFCNVFLKPFIKMDFEINNDIKILSCANVMKKDLVFYTNDLVLYDIAEMFFGRNNVKSVIKKEDNYSGYFEYTFKSDEEMANFYSNTNVNHFNLLINQYLILHNPSGEIIDKLCWTGEEHRLINYGHLNSKWFNVKPIKGDVQQQLLVDSFMNNKLTMVHGLAGSGKSTLSLAYLFYALDTNKIDKIIIFCNTVAAKDAAKLGLIIG